MSNNAEESTTQHARCALALEMRTLPALMRGSTALAIMCALAVACAHRSSSPNESPATSEGIQSLPSWIDRHVASLTRRRRGERFSGFLGVAREGRWVFAKGYAVDPGETVADADTRFRIGSMSKQFTAVVVMQLAEQGRLRLSDPIGKFVPGLGAQVAAVPLDNLLSHSSGIYDFTSNDALMATWMEPHPLDEVLATFKDQPLGFAPGQRFEYCNSNYLLLAMAADKVTGDFAAYLKSHVFTPAGMARSSGVDAPTAPNSAFGHTTGRWGRRIASSATDMILAFPGMVRSTGRDLVAWDRALARNTVLAPAAQATLLTPHTHMLTAKVRAKVPTFLGYGYGMNIVCDHDRVIHGHGGAMAGFNSFFARIPDEGWAVVVLADTDGFDTRSIGKPILQMILTQRPAVPGVNTERPCRPGSALE